MEILNDDVLENTIKCYEIALETPLDKATYSFLKELQRYRELGEIEELDELLNSLV